MEDLKDPIMLGKSNAVLYIVGWWYTYHLEK
jgi:hypothetical protein